MKSIKFVLMLFVVMLASSLVASASAQTASANDKPYYGYEKVVIAGQTWTAPDYINLEKFPPLGGKLSERDARILQLHQEPLSFAGWYVNELRERHTFEVIWLDKGQMVWVSNGRSDEPRYLVSCGNRISFLLAHKITYLTVTEPAPKFAPEPAPTPAPVAVGPKLKVRDFWRNLGQGIRNFLLYGPFLVPEDQK